MERFDAISDAAIDYSDMPEITDELFARAVKERVTVRLDADMLQWFKSQGRGYQTRMNAVLRAFYEAHRSGLLSL